jgi:hypothetical protein
VTCNWPFAFGKQFGSNVQGQILVSISRAAPVLQLCEGCQSKAAKNEKRAPQILTLSNLACPTFRQFHTQSRVILPPNRTAKNPAVMPCINGSFEQLLRTSRAESVAFDCQSRSVGHNRSEGAPWINLRFKNNVNNHEHGRVNSHVYAKELAPAAGAFPTMSIGCLRKILRKNPPTCVASLISFAQKARPAKYVEISEIFVEINNLRRSRNPEINDLRKAQGPGLAALDQPKRPAAQGRSVLPSRKRRRPPYVKEQAARAAPKHTLASLDGNAIKKFNLFFGRAALDCCCPKLKAKTCAMS